MGKFSVLGGSSPFTAGLVDSIADASECIMPEILMLHGRNSRNLELIYRYAKEKLERLGWKVESTESIERALSGSDMVLHQIRYGGLNGRYDDEVLAIENGYPPDETLGPSGLQSAIRMVPPLTQMAKKIREYSPNAWILNLTNPLSIAVAVLNMEGLKKVVGLCELPLVTMNKICSYLSLDLETVTWQYSGLNHRGFLHHLFYKGEDLLDRLVGTMGKESIDTIPSWQIRELNAVPLKYFCLFNAGKHTIQRRAPFLNRLRQEITEQLKRKRSDSPPGLSKRYMGWYPYSVIPMLEAVQANDGRCQIVNIPSGDIVMELKSKIFSDRIKPDADIAPPEPVKKWIHKFITHERSVITAACDPTPKNIKIALDLDPLVSKKGDIGRLTKQIQTRQNKEIQL